MVQDWFLSQSLSLFWWWLFWKATTQLVWEEYGAKYWLQKCQESMHMYHCNIGEIMLKMAITQHTKLTPCAYPSDWLLCVILNDVTITWKGAVSLISVRKHHRASFFSSSKFYESLLIILNPLPHIPDF